MADPDQNALPLAMFFNTLRMSVTAREVFFDLGQTTTEPGIANLVGRFVTSPAHAKSIMEVLQQLIANYETTYGTIQSAPEKGTEQ